MYLPSRKACEYLGVCANTLRHWANTGKIKYIRTPGNKRLYDCSTAGDFHAIKTNYCYCRVISDEYKDNLDLQRAWMEKRYPKYTVLCDIGPTSDFNRKNFRFLLDELMHKRVGTLIVSHKDRLCHFGFDLLEWLFDINEARLVILHPDETYNDRERDNIDKESENNVLSILASIINNNVKDSKKERKG